MADAPFKVGDRVVHPTFGEGLVLSVLGSGESVTYRVSFSRDGVQRKLLGRLARLERMAAADRPSKDRA